MKVALVQEWLTNMGGSECCVINFTEIYNNAPVYTTIHKCENLDEELQNIEVRTSFLQKFVIETYGDFKIKKHWSVL